MSVKVRIPRQIGRVFGAELWEEMEADSVDALVTALDARFPGLGERLTEPGGMPRRWVNFYVDGEDIRALGGMNTPLRPHAEVFIVPSVAGG